MKAMNNVVTAVAKNEAMLSHSLAEPVEKLLARELLAAYEQEEKQYIVEHERVLKHRLGELQARQLKRQARRAGRGRFRVSGLQRLGHGRHWRGRGLQVDSAITGQRFPCLLLSAGVQLFLFDASRVGAIVIGAAPVGPLAPVQMTATEWAAQILTSGVGGHGEEFDSASATVHAATAQLVAIPQRRLQRGAIGLNSRLGAVELTPI
jgi:hypothetical protein